MKRVNLGCGNRFAKDWVNIDFISNSPYVKQYNLIKGIPLPDNSCDVIYHSHVLEHFTKEDGIMFIKECYRVLKSGGILRIVVPDLEQLARQYITNLDTVLLNTNALHSANYKWSVIELFDQMVREKSGGEMLKYWESESIINEDHVINRTGNEFVSYRKQYLLNKGKGEASNNIIPKLDLIQRIYHKTKLALLKRLNIKVNDAYVGSFRSSGEIHKWMYDKYSLSCLLKNSGFGDIIVTDAFKSEITGWDEFCFLDEEENKPRKPDSLFMEAKKLS